MSTEGEGSGAASTAAVRAGPPPCSFHEFGGQKRTGPGRRCGQCP